MRERARELAPLRRRDHGHGARPRLARARRAPPARVLRARPGRPGDGPGRLHQRGDHRVPRPEERGGGASRRTRQRFARAGAALGSRGDRHHRPGVRFHGAREPAVARRARGARWPRAPLAQAAFRLGRFPAGRQSADRLVVAGQGGVSGSLPRGPARADARLLSALLPCGADRRAARRACSRAEADAARRAAPGPARLAALARARRRRAAGVRARPLFGLAGASWCALVVAGSARSPPACRPTSRPSSGRFAARASLAALGVGAALSVAGTAFQGLFRNPLVSPDILGASAGAALGAVLGIFFSLGIFGIQAAAFAGGLVAVALVYALGSSMRGGDPMLTLLLTGVVVGSLLGAGIGLVKYLADPYNQLPAMTFWLLGSLAGVDGQATWCRCSLPVARRHRGAAGAALEAQRDVAARRGGARARRRDPAAARRHRRRGDAGHGGERRRRRHRRLGRARRAAPGAAAGRAVVPAAAADGGDSRRRLPAVRSTRWRARWRRSRCRSASSPRSSARPFFIGLLRSAQRGLGDRCCARSDLAIGYPGRLVGQRLHARAAPRRGARAARAQRRRQDDAAEDAAGPDSAPGRRGAAGRRCRSPACRCASAPCAWRTCRRSQRPASAFLRAKSC